jgi:hypothetical protein
VLVHDVQSSVVHFLLFLPSLPPSVCSCGPARLSRTLQYRNASPTAAIRNGGGLAMSEESEAGCFMSLSHRWSEVNSNHTI